jgi:cholest-4-en-3-one 26-monooxygenase
VCDDLVMPRTDVNLFDTGLWADSVPHDAFRELRERPGLTFHPETEGSVAAWCLVRHADVIAASRRPETYSSRPSPFAFKRAEGAPDAGDLPMLINLDPPIHTKMRLLVNKGFTPRRVGALEQRIRAVVDDIIERASAAGTFDLVTDVAVELPLQVIAELVGVPAEDRHQVFSWTEQMMSGDDPEFANSLEDTQAAMASMYMYAEGLCEQRRAEPRDDLISVLLDAEITTDDGTKAHLTQQEIDVFFLLLQNAGSETTRNLITGGTLALLQHPDQLALLQADPDRIPAAVEELLRWVTPVTHFARTLTHDDVIAGQEIQAGEKVVLWYSSANRDEAAFANADRLDLTRQPNEHVAFGAGGPHFCLGASLARLEARCIFEALVPLIPRLEQVGEAERLRSNFINGIKHMPVRLR